MNEVKSSAVKANTPPVDHERGRIPVSEVWFDRPLPRLTQGAAYIGSGDGWKHFKVQADMALRIMIVSLPDRRVMRVPFENVTCFCC